MRIFKKRYMLAVSLFLLGLVIYASDPVKILATLRTIEPAYWLILPLPFLATSSLRIYRWKLLLSSTKKVGFFDLLPIQMAGLAISNITPGRVGEPAKALFLKKSEGIEVSKSLRSMVWERILDLLFLVLFSVPFIFSFLGMFNPKMVSLGRDAIVLVTVIILAFIFGLSNKSAGLRIAGIFERIPHVKKHFNQAFMLSFYGSNRIDKKTLFICAILTVVIWVFDASAFYIAFNAIGVTQFSLWFFATMLAFAIICGVVSFLPGGVGSTEGILILALGLLGVETSIAASGVLIARLFTLWIAIGVGFVSLAVINKDPAGKPIQGYL